MSENVRNNKSKVLGQILFTKKKTQELNRADMFLNIFTTHARASMEPLIYNLYVSVRSYSHFYALYGVSP